MRFNSRLRVAVVGALILAGLYLPQTRRTPSIVMASAAATMRAEGSAVIAAAAFMRAVGPAWAFTDTVTVIGASDTALAVVTTAGAMTAVTMEDTPLTAEAIGGYGGYGSASPYAYVNPNITQYVNAGSCLLSDLPRRPLQGRLRQPLLCHQQGLRRLRRLVIG